MAVIVTGAAGFIGMHVAERLVERGEEVIGIDSFNPYYDVALKEARAERLQAHRGFSMQRMDIADAEAVKLLFDRVKPSGVVHLAAQAGVRYSIENPFAYERSNLAGHLAILEACRDLASLRHLVYASSSSVYGDRPSSGAGFKETDATDAPVSLYAATKRGCELMSQCYAALYPLPQSGLRFFTVYGPWGRPDMAYYSFTRAISEGLPIDVYGEGRLARDFTYIDDIAEGVVAVLDRPAAPGEHRLLNIGASRPVGLMDMISTLERALGREAIKDMKPMQPGDVTHTYADVSALRELTGYSPSTSLEEGIDRFVHWYRSFHS
ncbi:MAG TPA: SDR family NAD(P)-dependent oxidoreductase [Allosphingosinicella sp.]|nr:SDR family NAD(P)-dependent oxidoreductase [Allosphingosinicella sp.]